MDSNNKWESEISNAFDALNQIVDETVCNMEKEIECPTCGSKVIAVGSECTCPNCGEVIVLRNLINMQF